MEVNFWFGNYLIFLERKRNLMESLILSVKWQWFVVAFFCTFFRKLFAFCQLKKKIRREI